MNDLTINEIEHFSFDNPNVRGGRVVVNSAYQAKSNDYLSTLMNGIIDVTSRNETKSKVFLR